MESLYYLKWTREETEKKHESNIVLHGVNSEQCLEWNRKDITIFDTHIKSRMRVTNENRRKKKQNEGSAVAQTHTHMCQN